MATADVDICNRALLRIGHKQPILALTDKGTPAVQCAVLYPQCRDELLCTFDWPFATKTSPPLAALTDTRPGWQYMYTAPTDMLKAQYIFSGIRRGAPLTQMSAVVDPFTLDFTGLPFAGISRPIEFAVEANDTLDGRVLLTDYPAPQLVYTADMTAVVGFPPLFANALAWTLAVELALALPIKPALAQLLEKKAQAAVATAAAQAFRESQEDAQPDSETISVRG